jgi:Ala-tRNA(Pro) deacylase
MDIRGAGTRRVAVGTQAALDEALGAELVPVCREGSFVVTGCGEVDVRGTARIKAYDCCRIRAHETASVDAYDRCRVVATDRASVRGFDQTHVVAFREAAVRAWDGVEVVASDEVSVKAHDSVHVVAHDHVVVTAFGGVAVDAHGCSAVSAYDDAVVVDRSPGVVVHEHGPRVHIFHGRREPGRGTGGGRVMSVVKRGLDLSEAGVEYELIPHVHTERAVDEAAALALPADEIAKTVVLHVDVRGDLAIRPTYARAVLPASERLDLHKLQTFFGESRRVRLATEEELFELYPDFDLGAVPPIGGRSGDAVVVDPRVTAREWTVLEAGTHEESVRMRTADLVALSRASIVDVCRD